MIEPKGQDGFYSCKMNDKIFVVSKKLKEIKGIIDFHVNQKTLDM